MRLLDGPIELHLSSMEIIHGYLMGVQHIPNRTQGESGLLVSGNNPLQLQGGPTCPRGRDARKEGGVEGRVNSTPSWSEDSQDKAEPKVTELTQHPGWSREELDQEAHPRRKQERGATPCH